MAKYIYRKGQQGRTSAVEQMRDEASDSTTLWSCCKKVSWPFAWPDCGKKHYIFGSDTSGVKVSAELPIVPGLAGLCDSGRIEDSDAVKYLDIIIIKTSRGFP